jgi:hypothetical protein
MCVCCEAKCVVLELTFVKRSLLFLYMVAEEK